MRISPDPDRFLELAAEHTVVPVWTEVLADLEAVHARHTYPCP